MAAKRQFVRDEDILDFLDNLDSDNDSDGSELDSDIDEGIIFSCLVCFEVIFISKTAKIGVFALSSVQVRWWFQLNLFPTFVSLF
jgi:hypothetical protein